MSARAGRQVRLRRRLAAAREELGDRSLVGVLADAELMIATNARGLGRRRHRRRVIAAHEDADFVLKDFVESVRHRTGRSVVVFHRNTPSNKE